MGNPIKHTKKVFKAMWKFTKHSIKPKYKKSHFTKEFDDMKKKTKKYGVYAAAAVAIYFTAGAASGALGGAAAGTTAGTAGGTFSAGLAGNTAAVSAGASAGVGLGGLSAATSAGASAGVFGAGAKALISAGASAGIQALTSAPPVTGGGDSGVVGSQNNPLNPTQTADFVPKNSIGQPQPSSSVSQKPIISTTPTGTEQQAAGGGFWNTVKGTFQDNAVGLAGTLFQAVGAGMQDGNEPRYSEQASVYEAARDAVTGGGAGSMPGGRMTDDPTESEEENAPQNFVEDPETLNIMKESETDQTRQQRKLFEPYYEWGKRWQTPGGGFV